MVVLVAGNVWGGFGWGTSTVILAQENQSAFPILFTYRSIVHCVTEVIKILYEVSAIYLQYTFHRLFGLVPWHGTCQKLAADR